jgi:hypothetical protein
MTDPRPPRTNEELVRVFDYLFQQTEPQTPDEVDAVLRDAGYDPDELAARVHDVAERALAESPLNWRKRASAQYQEAIAQLKQFLSTPRGKRSETLAGIQQALLELPPNQQAALTAHFRSLDQATDADLASLLGELEYLLAKSSQGVDHTEE